MPHLTFEYNDTADKAVDMTAFASVLRDAIVGVGLYPIGGVRVRGFLADVAVVADGGPHAFIHMTFRIGQGRSDEDKRRSAEAIYAAAEAWLSPAFQGRGVALSLALEELPPPGLSIKRFNTIRDHLGTEAAS